MYQHYWIYYTTKSCQKAQNEIENKNAVIRFSFHVWYNIFKHPEWLKNAL